eukprot:TRINITY_DN6194_c0_g2_i1.p1 TRINITY_DN6194_c0_g2~~TRINITY_DN6194_c0_g2_i1.p1  ORF type:complete len:108 (-),score=4.71 TRINITY_DN6194_c0_g2_i1:195-518(-)
MPHEKRLSALYESIQSAITNQIMFLQVERMGFLLLRIWSNISFKKPKEKHTCAQWFGTVFLHFSKSSPVMIAATPPNVFSFQSYPPCHNSAFCHGRRRCYVDNSGVN